MSSQFCGSKAAFRLGLACVALAAFGFVGLRYVEPEPQAISIGQHLAMAHDIFMQAFSDRALADAAKFKGEVELVFKEVGSEDPSERSKMRMKATMQREGQTKRDSPTLIATFVAKPGQQENLKEQFGKVLNTSQAPPHVTVTTGSKSEPFGEGEFVFIESPVDDTSAFEKEMKDSFKEQRPKILAEVNVGCTMDDMFDNGDKNILEVLNGAHVKASLSFAQSLFKLHYYQVVKYGSWAHDFGIYGAMFPAFATMKTRNDILYKADEFKDFPKVAQVMDGLNQTLQKAMKGKGKETLIQFMELWQFCDGVAGSQIVGLPSGMEQVLEFENFRPTKFMAAFGNPEARGSTVEEKECWFTIPIINFCFPKLF